MKGYSVTFAFFCSPSISSVSYPIPQITHGSQLYTKILFFAVKIQADVYLLIYYKYLLIIL